MITLPLYVLGRGSNTQLNCSQMCCFHTWLTFQLPNIVDTPVMPQSTVRKKQLANSATEEALSVLKEWVKLHRKPMKVMHDGGKEFTSTNFKNFLILNGIKDKQIPKGYPQEQGKVEAYNKIVIAEFLQVEEDTMFEDGLLIMLTFVVFSVIGIGCIGIGTYAVLRNE